jgi:hypothetical protein
MQVPIVTQHPRIWRQSGSEHSPSRGELLGVAVVQKAVFDIGAAFVMDDYVL